MKRIVMLVSLVVMLAACYQSEVPTGNKTPNTDTVLEELPLITDTDIEGAILEEDGNLIAIEAQEDEPFAEGEEIDLAGVNDPLPEVSESELSTQAIQDGSGFATYIFHNEGNEKPWKIIRVNMKTGKKSKVYEGKNRINSVAISGDGQKLVFAMKTKKTDNYEVYRLALPNNLKRITNTNYNENHVSMSADGNIIVWQGKVGSSQGIYIKEGSTRGFLSVATEQTYPSVSASGKIVAFVRKLNSGNEAVMFYNKLTGKYRKVFEAASGHTIKHPSATNGADKALWLHVGAKDILKLKKLDGKVRNILSQPSGSLRHPNMTANGKFVSFSAKQNGGWNVQVKSMGNGLVTPITGNASATKENIASYWQYVVDAPQQNNKVDYDSYSSEELPSWGEFSPLDTPSDAPTGTGTTLTELVNGTTYDCTVTPYSLTDNPDKIVTFDPDSEILWVGSLLQGKGYKDGIGSLNELPIRERAPVTLSINILSNNNSITVKNPTVASVNQAIGKLIARADKAGLKSGSDISFTQKETHSVEQAALKLGVAAKYMGFSIKAQLNASRSAKERTITAFFIQNMFTVSMSIPQTPEAVFSDDFTQATLDEQIALGRIGADNVPTYVSSIVYGRILKFSFTSTASEEKIKATLNAAYSAAGSGGEVNFTAEQKKILEESEIGFVTIGGDGQNALAIIRSGNLKDFFKKDSPLTTARPLSYTVRNLGDNSIAQISETTNYNVKECSARPVAETKVVPITSSQISNFVPPHTRGDREFAGHGPKVYVSTQLINQGTYLEANVYMKAEETKSDWTTASGSKKYRIYNVESGWRIKRIITDTFSSASYTDNDHGVDTLSLGSADLVNQFLVVGDTSGNDAGTDTRVSVNFNTITVELEKIQIIPIIPIPIPLN